MLTYGLFKHIFRYVCSNKTYIYSFILDRMKMASKSKTRDITIVAESGTFKPLFKKVTGKKKEYDFDGLKVLRKILSNEKARLLHVIKHKKPSSIYELSRILERDFKSVREDIKLLERFGFLELVSEKSGKRIRHKPVLIVDTMNFHIKL